MLLRSHHSAQQPPRADGAMGGRRALGRGSSAEDASLRAQLLQLLSGGGAGGGGGGGNARDGDRRGGRGGNGGNGGGGGRSGGVSAAPSQPRQSRQGDWTCTRCDFVNFAFRRVCHRCAGAQAGQSQRPLSAAAAGPLRPQLAARQGQRPATLAEARSTAARAGQPSFHVPRPATTSAARGAAVGEMPQQHVHRAADARSAEATVGRAAAQPAQDPSTSYDGADRGDVQEGPAAADAGRGAPTEILPRRRRWADETPPCDRMCDVGEEGDSELEEEDGDEERDEGIDNDDGYWTSQPTAEDLRSRWAAECRVVKALERVEWDIGQGQSAALHAAIGARDRAEREWRDAIAPKPVAVRMGTAQRKVNRAQRAVDRASAALQQFDEDTAVRRTELCEVLRDAEARRDERQSELDDLHLEAGEVAAKGSLRGRGAAAAASGAERLLDEVVRDVQALVESLEEGSDARGRANLLLAKVASAPEPTGAAECQLFDIGTDGEGRAEESDGFRTVVRRGRGAHKPQAEAQGQRGAKWSEAANGRWSRHQQEANAKGTDAVEAASTQIAASATRADSTAAAPPTLAAPGEHAPLEGSAVRTVPKPAGSTQAGKGGRPAPSGQHEGQPPHKSHRGHDDDKEASVESACDDAARALALKGEQEAAIQAAQAANACFGDEVSMQIAGQLYARKVHKAQERAAAVGVDPTVGGMPLIQLPPDAFNKWVQEILTPAERAKSDAEEGDL